MSNHHVFSVPPTTSEYQYQGRKHFTNPLHYEYHRFLNNDIPEPKSQFIIFSHLNKQSFLDDFANSNDIQFSHSYNSYIYPLGLLLVKLTTEADEEAHGVLDKLIISKLTLMDNRQLDLHSLRKAAKTSNSRSQRPDTAYRPVDLPAGRSDKWPSTVIETGYSEGKSKLAEDARWWLTESRGDVKNVLTVSVHQTKKEIVIESWGWSGRPTRAESARRVPEVKQRVVITQSINQPVAHVAGAPLTIPFEDLFLRQPVPSSREEDLVFNLQELKYMAYMIWQVCGNV